MTKFFGKLKIWHKAFLLLGVVVFFVLLFPTSGEWLGFVSQFANRVVGGLFSAIPFSVMTVAILLLPVFVALVIWRVVVNKKRKTMAKFFANCFAVLCAVYFLFACMLGLNYRKQSVYDKMGFAQIEVTAAQVANASDYVINVLNQCADEILHYGGVDFDGFDRNVVLPAEYSKEKIAQLAHDEIEKQNFDFLYDFSAKPKYTFVPGILSWMGFDGIYFPLFGELNIDSSIKTGNLAVLLTHETIHSKGILNEEQTEFLAQYICVHSDDLVLRYSGSYTATIYLLQNLKNTDQNAFKSQLLKIKDKYLRQRISFVVGKEKEQGFLTQVANFFYDLYLRLNYVNGANAYDDSVNGWARFCNTKG
ncbi:MAG: DUF3810 family protein [Clostridia bacterium]|nr:DUF3810 family protein [Clostridia bacterium]